MIQKREFLFGMLDHYIILKMAQNIKILGNISNGIINIAISNVVILIMVILK